MNRDPRVIEITIIYTESSKRYGVRAGVMERFILMGSFETMDEAMEFVKSIALKKPKGAR